MPRAAPVTSATRNPAGECSADMTAIVSRWAHARHSAGTRTVAAPQSAGPRTGAARLRRAVAGRLTPSLFAALGVPGMTNPLGIRPARRVCLLLVDGLGAEQLTAHADDAPFLSGLATGSTEPGAGLLTAGFPSAPRSA